MIPKTMRYQHEQVITCSFDFEQGDVIAVLSNGCIQLFNCKLLPCTEDPNIGIVRVINT